MQWLRRTPALWLVLAVELLMVGQAVWAALQPLLYYPGYRAEADGTPLRVARGDNNVVRLYGVPEGSGTAVRVAFEAPGLWLGAQALSALGAVLLSLSLAGMRRRRGA